MVPRQVLGGRQTQDPDDVLLLDASTSYAMAPIGDNRPDSSKRPRWGQSVPERIHGYAENAKFIYMLRKPADRTYSAYWHNVRSGQEKMPFRDAIEAHPVYLETSKYHAQIAIFLKHFDLKEFYLVDFKIFPVIRASTRPPVWNFSNYPNATSNSSWKSKKINHFNIIRSAGRCRECSVRTKVSNRPTS